MRISYDYLLLKDSNLFIRFIGCVLSTILFIYVGFIIKGNYK